MERPGVRVLRYLLLGAAVAGVTAAASAQVKLDVSVPWGPGEFHSLNAARFAEAVKAATGGEVVMTTHAGGTLGVKANESLRGIGEGVVPMGDYALFQNASRGAVLAVETLPFLVKDYDDLATLHKSFRPLWEKVLERNNQKALYIVPWPNQFFFVKRQINRIEDFQGLRMRSLDRLTTDWINRLGMTPVQVTNLEILQALGSGMVDGVPTSAGTAVAQKYWDFMKYGYQTNHIWASNVMAINLDAWRKLKPEHQAAIEKVARDLEPEFWQTSKQDHEKKVAELKAQGMDIQPASAALVSRMVERTTPLWEEYTRPMGKEALEALASYRKATGK